MRRVDYSWIDPVEISVTQKFQTEEGDVIQGDFVSHGESEQAARTAAMIHFLMQLFQAGIIPADEEEEEEEA